MNYKVFFKELFWSALPTIAALGFVAGFIFLGIYNKDLLKTFGKLFTAILVILLLLVFWIEPAYKKAKQEKPKCHWKVRWPKYNEDGTAIFQTECNDIISGIREKCKCGKEVVVDL